MSLEEFPYWNGASYVWISNYFSTNTATAHIYLNVITTMEVQTNTGNPWNVTINDKVIFMLDVREQLQSNLRNWTKRFHHMRTMIQNILTGIYHVHNVTSVVFISVILSCHLITVSMMPQQTSHHLHEMVSRSLLAVYIQMIHEAVVKQYSWSKSKSSFRCKYTPIKVFWCLC